ncbi:YitT family protein [Caulobacter segnis]|uniref:YitT family protein n=1 Tax=Caulobacter segnis TaxID=88688 RepID=UPI00240EECF5|nr:YitT family protein [Caulobacter segnis]MDG2521309.1 YitT family protein [Caulobacter segnis]
MSAPRHTASEDIHSILIGTSFIAVGIALLKAAGLVTGGIAGLALIVSYATGWQVGLLFFALNIPFYELARRTMGWTFTLKTLATNALLAAFTAVLPLWLKLDWVDPVFSALFGGTIIGMGVLALARHRSSVGGIGVLAMYMQEKRGVSAGRVQLTADILIIAAAFTVIDFGRLALSLLSAAALSLVIIVNHRPGRYAGY